MLSEVGLTASEMLSISVLKFLGPSWSLAKGSVLVTIPDTIWRIWTGGGDQTGGEANLRKPC